MHENVELIAAIPDDVPCGVWVASVPDGVSCTRIVRSAGVAHEINNPLCYILGNLELVEREFARAGGA